MPFGPLYEDYNLAVEHEERFRGICREVFLKQLVETYPDIFDIGRYHRGCKMLKLTDLQIEQEFRKWLRTMNVGVFALWPGHIEREKMDGRMALYERLEKHDRARLNASKPTPSANALQKSTGKAHTPEPATSPGPSIQPPGSQ